MKHATQQAAEWIAATTYADLPESVTTAALRAITDTLGVAFAGATTAQAEAARRHARAQHGTGLASVIGFSDGTSARGAAYANTVCAHALDFDDTSYAGICHGSAVVLPAVLAVAEQEGRSGQDLLRGFVAGSEITYALGKLVGNSVYDLGWFMTSVLGAVGAAAGAAAVLGLDTERTTGALNNALVATGGARAILGSPFKPFLAAHAAALGVDSAYLAAAGTAVSGPVAEHKFGFTSLIAQGSIADPAAFDQLGLTWSLISPGLALKRYPVCSAAQAAIEAVNALCSAHGISADSIEAIDCHVPQLVAISLPHPQPATPTECQFSLPFGVACAVVFGGPGIERLSATVFEDPAIVALMKRIRMCPLPKEDPLARALAPEGARVEIRTVEGGLYERTVAQAAGMPEVPLSEAALVEKFIACTDHAGIDGAALHAALRGLAARRDLRGLLRPS